MKRYQYLKKITSLIMISFCISSYAFGSKKDFMKLRAKFQSSKPFFAIESDKNWLCTASDYVFHLKKTKKWQVDISLISNKYIEIVPSDTTPMFPERYSQIELNGATVWRASGTSTLNYNLYLRQFNSKTLIIESTMDELGAPISDQVSNCNSSINACYIGNSITEPEARVGGYKICVVAD